MTLSSCAWKYRYISPFHVIVGVEKFFATYLHDVDSRNKIVDI